MRLNVTHDFSSREMNVAWYMVRNPNAETDDDNSKSIDRLVTLTPCIEAMSRAVLSEDFIKSTMEGPHFQLCFTLGISKGPKRFDFRSLLGWIELCDVEPKSL